MGPTTPSAPLLISLAECARMLGVSTRFVRILANRNQLRLVRLGRRALVPRAEIDRLVAEGAL